MADPRETTHRPTPDAAGRKTTRERDLDEALEDTFPASDPVTVGHPTADEPAHAPKGRKTPLLDIELIKRLARNLRRSAGSGKGD